MQTPTARLLELLELLQARPLDDGRRDRRPPRDRPAARCAATSPRCRSMDIPVEGQRGVGGGYRVRPGYRLPPLMLSDDEAVVVVLGLIAARRQGLDSGDGAADGALTKIHRVLPDLLRRRVEALETALGFTASPRVGRAGHGRHRPAARRRRPPRPPRPHRVPGVLGRADATGAEPLRAGRPLGAAGTSPRTTTCATTCARSGRPDAPHDACSTRRRLSRARGVRRGGAREPVARARARGATRSRCCSISPSTARRGGSRRRSRSSSRRTRDAAADARRLARLDGRHAREPRCGFRSSRRTSSGRASASSPTRGSASLGREPVSGVLTPLSAYLLGCRPTTTTAPLRRDARANRDRILEAARVVVRDGGSRRLGRGDRPARRRRDGDALPALPHQARPRRRRPRGLARRLRRGRRARPRRGGPVDRLQPASSSA